MFTLLTVNGASMAAMLVESITVTAVSEVE